MAFGLIIGTDIVELFEGLQHLFPFGHRNDHRLLLAVLIYDILFIDCYHLITSHPIKQLSTIMQ